MARYVDATAARPDLAALAGRLVAARAPGGDPAVNADGACLRDFDDCYAVQRRVAAALGPVGAFKMARKPDAPQIMAPILARDIRHSPARFEPGELRHIGVELEIGFVVTRPLPDCCRSDFATAARSCVAVAPVIEVVDCRFADLESASPLLRLADNQINGGLVVGPRRDDWSDLDLGVVTARLSFGGQTVLDGPAQVPGGDAFETFLAFAAMVGDHCGGLAPGQVVITGSLNGLPYVQRGTQVRGEIAGLGAVAVDFPA